MGSVLPHATHREVAGLLGPERAGYYQLLTGALTWGWPGTAAGE
jgi:hypothetical protein